MTDFNDVVRRMARKIQLASGWGRTSFADDSQSAQLLQVTLSDQETRDGTPRIAEFGLTSVPPAGSDVLVVFLGGDRTKGVVVATGHQASRPLGLVAGETMLYDLQGKHIYLTNADGIVIEAAGTPVTVNNSTIVTINASESVVMQTPILKVSGDIQDNYQSNPNTVAQMRAIYNGHHHGSSPIPDALQ
jgi:phage baseplate assembly protein V